MDERFLNYYNRELRHIREMGAEFAEQYPKIAARLGVDKNECADPYVERLLEGFAFMAARVQLKIDSQFPVFTQHLLETIYPHYLAPVPAMAVVQFNPQPNDDALGEGIQIQRGTALQSVNHKDSKTTCEFRTAQAVTLWPLELTEARYFPSASSLVAVGVKKIPAVKAGIRLRFHTTAGLAANQLSMDSIRLYLTGSGSLPMKIYEHIFSNALGTLVRPKGGHTPRQYFIGQAGIQRVGLSAEDALLPYPQRSFEGYRLLQEYFYFPERYLFVDLTGVQKPLAECASTEFELFILLDQGKPEFEALLDAASFALNCAPIINLFSRRADRIYLNRSQTEYHVLPDRTRPMDFEVFSIDQVRGFGTSNEPLQEFYPYYADNDGRYLSEDGGYYCLHRSPRQRSNKQKRNGTRSNYIGNEVYISLVDAHEAPFRHDLKQLGLEITCTNRDLPLHLIMGQGRTDFTLDTGIPIDSIRCLAGPTKPKPTRPPGESRWRLINHLSLNYLSLSDTEKGAAGLRELLSLYADTDDRSISREIDGILSVSTKPLVARIPTHGPITFGRGLEVTITLDESAFEGTGIFMLGAILELFFSKYVATNSFTETVIRSSDRGEIKRWPARIGLTHRL